MRLLPKTQKQQLQLHQQANNLELDDDDDDDGIEITDVCVTYRRPKVVHDDHGKDDELSDYVMTRLAQARELAMAKYRELHS